MSGKSGDVSVPSNKVGTLDEETGDNEYEKPVDLSGNSENVIKTSTEKLQNDAENDHVSSQKDKKPEDSQRVRVTHPDASKSLVDNENNVQSEPKNQKQDPTEPKSNNRDKPTNANSASARDAKVSGTLQKTKCRANEINAEVIADNDSKCSPNSDSKDLSSSDGKNSSGEIAACVGKEETQKDGTVPNSSNELLSKPLSTKVKASLSQEPVVAAKLYEPKHSWRELKVKVFLKWESEADEDVAELVQDNGDIFFKKMKIYLRRLFCRCGIVECIQIVSDLRDSLDKSNRTGVCEGHVCMNRVSEAARTAELWDGTDHKFIASVDMHLEIFWGYSSKDALLNRKTVSVKLELDSEMIETSSIEDDMLFRFGSCGSMESIQVLEDPCGAIIRFGNASSAARAVEDAIDRGSALVSGRVFASVDILYDEKVTNSMGDDTRTSSCIGAEHTQHVKTGVNRDTVSSLKRLKYYPPTTGRTRPPSVSSSAYVGSLNKRTRSLEPGSLSGSESRSDLSIDRSVSPTRGNLESKANKEVNVEEQQEDQVYSKQALTRASESLENEMASACKLDSKKKTRKYAEEEPKHKHGSMSSRNTFTGEEKETTLIAKSHDDREAAAEASRSINYYESMLQKLNARSGLFLINLNQNSLRDIENLVGKLSGTQSYQVSIIRKGNMDGGCAFVSFESDVVAMEARRKLDGMEFPKGSKNFIKAVYAEGGTRKRRTEANHSHVKRSNTIRARHEGKESREDSNSTINSPGLGLQGKKGCAKQVDTLPSNKAGRESDTLGKPDVTRSSKLRSGSIDDETRSVRQRSKPMSKGNQEDECGRREITEPADDLADSFRSAVDLGYAASEYDRRHTLEPAGNAHTSASHAMNRPIEVPLKPATVNPQRHSNTVPVYTHPPMPPAQQPISHHSLVGSPHSPNSNLHYPPNPMTPFYSQNTSAHGHNLAYTVQPHLQPHWDNYGPYYNAPPSGMQQQILEHNYEHGRSNRDLAPVVTYHGQAQSVNIAQRHTFLPANSNLAVSQTTRPSNTVGSRSGSSNGSRRGGAKVKQEGAWHHHEEASAPLNTSRLYVRFERPFQEEDTLHECFDKAAPGLEYVSRHLGKSFAFVKYSSSESAFRARSQLDGQIVLGQKIRVSIADPPRAGRKRQRTGENSVG